MSANTKKKTGSWISFLGILCAFFLMGVFLITAIEAVVYWTPGYFEKEYTKYHVLNDLPEMTMEDLLTVTKEMMAYLRDNREDLHIFTNMGGEYREFFNEREIAHMVDVKELFIGGLWIRRLGILFTALFALGLYFWSRSDSSRKQTIKDKVPYSLCLGTGIFFALALAIAGLVSTNFHKYFFIFHYIFFDNDLWILNPATDMLINIVPEPFFVDTAVRIALTFAVMVIAFLGLNCYLYRRWKNMPKPKKNAKNKNKNIKHLCMVLCTALTCSAAWSTPAYALVNWPSNISIAADGGIVMDANSGTILYEKNMNQSYYPASITKILTALVILEQCDLDEMVTFSHTAVNTLEPGASIVGARVGDQMTVRDCLYALLLQSANEVANALAEHCSGSIEDFAQLMTDKAKSLGCLNSNFANPSGLNNENHYTSAYDMALIAQAAFNNPTFVEIDSTLYYDIEPGQLQQYPDGWRYYAHHQMLKKNNSNYYEGIIGGKTGYTSLAGNTLVTCAERDGMKLIAVVLNGHQTHYSDTKSMLDFGFKNFKSVAVAAEDSTYQKVEQDLAIGGIFAGETTKLSVNSNSVVTLPQEADFSNVMSSLDYNLDSSAPDHAVARIDYMYGDRIVGQAYLEASTIPEYEVAAPVIETEPDMTENTNVSEPADIPDEKTTDTADTDSFAPGKFFSILKIVLLVLAVIGILGAVIFGILIIRQKQEEKERMLRRQKREKRMKDWGYSSTDFDLIMQEHLRSKNQFKKRSFWDRFRR